MSIKARVTQSALTATLIMAFCFPATEAVAADWIVDSMGYTLNCDIEDIKKTYFGQWKTFEARFSLPADTGVKLWYECEDRGGKNTTGDPAYDFHCKVKVDQSGGSFSIAHDRDESDIKGLVPGYVSPNFACKKVAEAAKVEVRKSGR